MKRVAIIVAMLGLSVSAMSGCGKSEATPKTAQASIKGSVTNGGKSLPADCLVVFFCAEHNATLAGKIDSLGKFQLKPSQKSIGIPAGRYKVAIQVSSEESQAVGSEAYTEMMKKGVPTTKKAEKSDLIPAIVSDLQTSKLALEVAEGENNFDIDLAKLPQ